MLRNWVYDHVGGVHLSEFTLDDGLRVLSHVPADSSRALHRHVAQVLVRLFTLAAFPCRLIEVSPLPRKFLPSLGDPKEKPFLYPREDAQLLACTEVPLEWRVFFALCAREGFRSSELAGGVIDKRKVEALTWAALDEVHGAISLDDTKTGAARTWAADDGVIRALNLWKMICGHKKPTDPIVNVPFGNRATLLRAYLARAKVERPELTHRSATRARIKAHSLRGTFITLSLANGKTETWVQDRTGHTSTIMINRYRRAARTAAELGLGPLTPMDLAIPELAAVVGQTENQGDATAKGQEHKSNDGQTRQGAADTSKETQP
jgi:integrase